MQGFPDEIHHVRENEDRDKDQAGLGNLF